MSSTITNYSNTINIAFPIAGEDNDSQGFRNNFSHIQGALKVAATEISNLQLATAGGSLGIGNFTDIYVSSTATVSRDLKVGSNIRMSGGNISGVDTIAADTGYILDFQTITGLIQTATISYANIASRLTIGNNTIIPSNYVNGTGSFNIKDLLYVNTTTNFYEKVTFTKDILAYGDTTATNVYIENFLVFNPDGYGIQGTPYIKVNKKFISAGLISDFSYNNLTNNSAANTTTLATSYFTTTGASTATLAAGTPGLIKKFIMVGNGGDMVITVANAGWKSSGSGTMTFNAIGQGCTLQFGVVDDKWFCTGNNGAVFG